MQNLLNHYDRYSYSDDTLKFPLSLILDENSPSEVTLMLTPNSARWDHVNFIFYSEAAKQQTDFSLSLSSEHKNFFNALYKQPWIELLESRQMITLPEGQSYQLNFNLSQFPVGGLRTEIYIPEFDLYEALREMTNNNIEVVYAHNFEKLQEDLLALTTQLPKSFIVEHSYDHNLIVLFCEQLSATLVKFRRSQDKKPSLPIFELKQAINTHPDASEEQRGEVARLFAQITERVDNIVKKKIKQRPFFAVSNAAQPAVVPSLINNNNREYNPPSYNQ